MDIAQYLKDNLTAPRVIIDGGAYVGAFTDEMRAAFPDATIYAFEPGKKCWQDLLKKYKDVKKVKVNKLALDYQNAKQKQFTVTSAHYNSSLLPLSKEIGKYVDASLIQVMYQEFVTTTTIDTYCQKNKIKSIDVLKLDLQGYDFYALTGAVLMLPRTKYVVVELLYVPLYASQCFAWEIEHFLKSFRFEFQFLANIKTGPDGKTWWADGVFKNTI